MTETGHPEDDLILDLALGSADGPTEDALVAHLAGCAACRREYDELADAIEQTLAAVPRVPPPPGFGSRVLAALHTGGAAADLPTRPDLGAPAARPRGWGRAWPAVAAGIVGLVAGGAIAFGLADEPPPRADTPASSAAEPGALLTADGTAVGRVAPSIADGREVLVVEVTDGPVGASYTCRLVLADGSSTDVGTWELDPDRANSWVVPNPEERVESVELVGESGQVWSTARW